MVENIQYMVENIQPVVVSRHTHTKIKLTLTSAFRREKRTLTLPSSEKVDTIRRHGQFIAKLSEDTGQVIDLRDYNIFKTMR
jgi:translation elongation factor P/translation initiation factor 5A